MKRFKAFILAHKIGAIISVFLLVAIVSIMVVLIIKLSKDPKNSIIATNDPTQIELVSDQQIVALDNSDYGIAPTSTFKLTTKEATTETDIRAAFTVIPEKAYQVETVSEQEFILKFESAFEQNSIIKMQYNREGKSEGWAFQTQKIFGIAGTFPGQNSYVPINTGIEILFTKDVPQSMDSYFTISPATAGTFQYDKNKVIFLPNDDLVDGTIYTITIGKGFGFEEESLIEDYSFSFDTEGKYTGEKIGFYSSSVIMNEQQQGIDFYVDSSKEVDPSVQLKLYTLTDSTSYVNGLEFVYSRTDSSQPFLEILQQIDYSEVAEFNTKIQTYESDEGTNHYIELPEPVPIGYYLLEVSQEDLKVYQFIQVCNYQAYVAITDDELLAWVVNPDAGVSCQGFSVEFNSETLGVTNKDGILSTPFTSDLDTKKNWYPVITDLIGNTFVVDIKADYYSSWYAEYNYPNKKQYWTYFYTDRSTYLPTDTIEFFGFVQKIDQSKLSEVDVRLVYDDIILDSKKATLTENGSFECQFEIENYLNSYLNIEVYEGETCLGTENISIAYFEKPTYKIETSMNKEFVLTGDDIDITAKQMFYEGTPVANGSVKMTTSDGVNNATLTLDENGIVIRTIQPDSSGNEGWEPYYYWLNFTSNSYDKNYNYTQDGFIFFPRNSMLELLAEPLTENSFQIKSDLHAIILENFQGQLYDYDSYRGEAIAAQRMTIEIVETYYEKTYQGQTYDYINKVTYDKYTYNWVENILSTETVMTDENGQYTFEFTEPFPERNYSFKFSTTDQRGQNIVQDVSYYDPSNYGDNDEPYVYTEKDYYKRNENVTVGIYSNNQPIEDTDKNSALFLTCQDGIVSYELAEDLSTSFVYDEKYISNAYVLGVYFDGQNLYPLWQESIYFDYEATEQLNIEITPDATDYKPGAEVNLEVKVTDVNGNPVKSDVNISVVDEAYFALFEDYSDPLNELYIYEHTLGILRQKTLKPTGMHEELGGAEWGGGGGDGSMRDDFKTTAFFDTLTTNSEGIGSTSFVIPDNLSSWRITTTALTQDLKAGKNTTNINCKLSFFLTDMLFDTYLSNDTISATVITSGIDTSKDQDISYTATIEDEKGNEVQVKATGKGLEYTSLPLGQLKAGTYTVTLTAKSGAFSDSIQKVIHVVDTLQLFELTKKTPLTEDIELISNDNTVGLTFLNEDAAWQYEGILNIYHKLDSKRIDLRAAAFTAGNYLNETYGSDLPVDVVDSFKEQMVSGLFSESDIAFTDDFHYADHQITPFVLLSDLYKNGHFTDEALNTMKDQLNYQMTDTYTTSENNFASMWGLAIINEPVLLATYKAMESEAFLSKELNFEKLYTVLSLIDIGDLKNAKAVYLDLKTEYGVKSKGSLQMTADDSRKMTALMMLAAVKLGYMDDADLMYHYIGDGKDYKYPTDMERLQYLMAKEPVQTTCSFDYTLNNETHQVKLNYKDDFQLNLLPEEAASIQFTNIEGNVSVIRDFIGTVDQIEPAQDLAIGRVYKVNGVVVDESNLHQSDLVEVCLTVHLAKDLWSYEINDILPAGLVYYNYNYQDNVYAYCEDQDKHINIYGYAAGQMVRQHSYFAVAIEKGSYTADNVVIKNLYTNEANYAQQQTLTIQ